jgi:hypothetical protein
MAFDGNVVVGLHPRGQGARQGVAIGWKVVLVDGRPIDDDTDALPAALAQSKRENRDALIEFVPLPSYRTKRQKLYRVLYEGLKVTSASALHSPLVCRLPLNRLVEVLEIVPAIAGDDGSGVRSRARLADPPGWASLASETGQWSWLAPLVPTNSVDALLSVNLLLLEKVELSNGWVINELPESCAIRRGMFIHEINGRPMLADDTYILSTLQAVASISSEIRILVH